MRPKASMAARAAAALLMLVLGACGTKGGLDCPPGTVEREDGTCIKAPAEQGS